MQENNKLLYIPSGDNELLKAFLEIFDIKEKDFENLVPERENWFLYIGQEKKIKFCHKESELGYILKTYGMEFYKPKFKIGDHISRVTCNLDGEVIDRKFEKGKFYYRLKYENYYGADDHYYPEDAIFLNIYYNPCKSVIDILPLRGWKFSFDSVEEDIENNDRNVRGRFKTKEQAEGALSAAVISQLMPYYGGVVPRGEKAWEITSLDGPINEGYWYGGLLRFKTLDSALNFIKLENNLELVKKYLKVF